MAHEAKIFAQAVLGGTLGTLFTATENHVFQVRTVILTNTDSVERTATLYGVANGDVAGTKNIFLNAYPIGAGKTVMFMTEYPVTSQMTLQGIGSAADVIGIQVSGVDIS